MYKLLLPFVLFIFLAAIKARGQTAGRDSVVKIAFADAQKFRLNSADMKKFRKDRRNSNSDYFKPSKNAVRDSSLLRDSAYVIAYRQLTYQKTRHRRTGWHYAWVSMAVYDGVYVALLLGVILTGHVANLR